MRKSIMASMACMLALIISACSSSPQDENATVLKSAIRTLNKDQVTMQELCPFEWDTLYTVRPYMEKEEIEECIGVESEKIQDTMVSEGLTYLLFIKGDEVVSCIYGRSESLGYSINFGVYREDVLKITYEEPCNFSVKHEKGITYLTYQKD